MTCDDIETMERNRRSREIEAACPRCREAREAVAAAGFRVSRVPDHGDDFCAAQSVELAGPGTFSAPAFYRQVRAESLPSGGAR